MGRFDPVYSDEQRQAVVSAVLDRNMTYEGACKAAQAGELGLEPFTFNPSTLGDYVRKERARRQRGEWETKAGGTVEEQYDAAAELAKRIAVAQLQSLEHKRDLEPSDLERLRKATQCLREARSLQRGLSTIKGSSQKAAVNGDRGTVQPEPPNPKPSPIENMLARAKAKPEPKALTQTQG